MFRALRQAAWFLLNLLVILTILGLAAAGLSWKYVVCPIYEEYRQGAAALVETSRPEDFLRGGPSYVYAADGTLLARLCGDEDSSYLPFEEIPKTVIDAFVAVEDRSFWENPGYDLRGILRVGVDFLRSRGAKLHGASTITQQLARGQFLSREVTLERKAREILLAFELTKAYSKEQIMEFYVNSINYANTYYGIEAAAQGYFSKPASALTLSETAYLCAIPNSPSYYNPYTDPEHAVVRRDKILAGMLECGYIDETDYEQAVREEIRIQKPEYPFYNYETSYAVECAVRELMKQGGFAFRYGIRDRGEWEAYQESYAAAYEKAREELFHGGYVIRTSLELDKQARLQQAVDEGLSFDTELSGDGIYAFQGSAALLDNETGKVLAIVGGRTQEASMQTFNRAFQGNRQPGSTIKPLLVYGPALEAGMTPDSPVKDISVTRAKEPDVDIKTLSGARLSMRRALERSRNGCAYWLYDQITPERGMEYLNQMGFGEITPDDYGMSACLGGLTVGVTAEEMAGAYRILVNSGCYKKPTCLVSMQDREGRELYQEEGETRIFQEQTADTLLDMLKGVITRGTASSMGWRSSVEAAGKTGTTNQSRDGWFCGMTPYYTLTVWVGYDTPRELSTLYGATYPARIWKAAMQSLIDGLEPRAFGKAAAEIDNTLSAQAREAMLTGDLELATSLISQIGDPALREAMEQELAVITGGTAG
ncbi:MAG: penicillin-binding protein [Lachnospiraceae bacterium]|nr:penicillin-binding protein [Lachnospiraceae bacterium]